MKLQLINFCEFDKYATQSYCAIHDVDESLNLGDITKVDETKIADFNMMTWGFPCTDISVAGKGKGFIDADGNKTRSGMYYEGIRILREKKPALSIIENVKNLTGKKFKTEFQTILNDLEECGYNTYWQVLNAKNYGVPQKRERVFLVSVRKDLDNGKFAFPKGFDNGIRLKDILEDEVDEKFYIDREKTEKLISQLKTGAITRLNTNPSGNGMNGNVNISDIANCITTNKGEGQKICLPCITPDRHEILEFGKLEGTNFNQSKVVYSPEGVAPTLRTFQMGGLEPKVMVKDATKQGYAIAEIGDSINLEQPNSLTRRGRVGKGMANTLTTACNQAVMTVERTPLKFLDRNGKKTDGDYAFCVDTVGTGGIKENYFNGDYRIRKLTPLECFRLMGFSDTDFNKAKDSSTSNSQLYKQAGNSIVTDVLFYILLELHNVMPYLLEDVKLSSFFSGIGAFEIALKRLKEHIKKDQPTAANC